MLISNKIHYFRNFYIPKFNKMQGFPFALYLFLNIKFLILSKIWKKIK